jgi:arylsulfatase I/J
MIKTTFSAPPSTPAGDQPASPLPKNASKGFLSDLERADD